MAQNTPLNTIVIDAALNSKSNSIFGLQNTSYYNNSNDTLTEIYLHSWAGAYRESSTELGKRLREDRETAFYFADEEERGNISKLIFKNEKGNLLKWKFFNISQDIIKLQLNKPLPPKSKIEFTTSFNIKLPDAKFTGFGYESNGYYLKEWYIVPAVYDNGNWNTMSNKNLDDLFTNQTLYLIRLNLSKQYQISSNLLYQNNYLGFNKYQATISGTAIGSVNIMIRDNHEFKQIPISTTQGNIIDIETDLEYPYNLRIETSLENILKKQLNFLENKLGVYKKTKLWMSSDYIKNNPIYTMNSIPFITIMGPKFQKEIEYFKTMSYYYIKSSINTNIRENSWLIKGLTSYLLAEYINTYYPEKKLFGNLSEFWVSRLFDLSDLSFNDRQQLLYLIMARMNYDQAIGNSQDDFSNLNLLAINEFKTSMGLAYLNDYMGDWDFNKSLKRVYNFSTTNFTNQSKVKDIFEKNTTRNTDWFFDDFVKKNNLINFGITRHKKEWILQNKTSFSGPLKVMEYKNDTLLSSKWVNNFAGEKTYIPTNHDADKIEINNSKVVPEYDYKDNQFNYNNKWYSILRKPIQFKIMQDIENPKYYQIFVNPEGGWNAYDGVSLGPTFSNSALIEKQFNYKIAPFYSFRSNSLTGHISVNYAQLPRNSKHIQRISYGLFAKYSHYNDNLGYYKYNPYINLTLKKKDPRSDSQNSIFARYVYIDRELPKSFNQEEIEKYAEFRLFNIRHKYHNPEIIEDLKIRNDLQIDPKFFKLSSEIRWRKILENKQKLDFRVFAGFFPYHNTDTDYFDFGLNSSTDYLFDLGYYGRSEETGFLSQQLITNDGSFKSDYEGEFANKWMLTTNLHSSIWHFLEVYTDIGLYKNKGQSIKYRWDAGIRLNIVPELIEIYMPIYSNNGSEILDLSKYPEKLRFVFIADLQGLLNYYRRGLY